MQTELVSSLEGRASLLRALGEPVRLQIVDLLSISDRTPSALRDITALEWNLLEFHLGALQAAGIVERRRSEGDRRRRYLRLSPDIVNSLPPIPRGEAVRLPLFVCTQNSARSPFAAALWQKLSGRKALSAGSDPAESVHPLAVTAAIPYGLDLSRCRPRGYDEIAGFPDVVVSVCDRALEGGLPPGTPHRHWSVPDPVGGDRKSFQIAFADLADRVEQLARASA